MRRFIIVSFSLLTATYAVSASAQGSSSQTSGKLRELCTERPGLTTAACTIDPGHLQIEIGLAAWERDRTAQEKDDTLELGEIQARYGLGETTEMQVSWTAYTRDTAEDFSSGAAQRASGIGDVTLGFKQNLLHPQEKAPGLAAGILPYVVLPAATNGVGDGDWSAGLTVPLSYKFGDLVTFALSPQIQAAVDEDRHGRHLAFGAAAGLQFSVTDTLRLSPEIEVMRDQDPEGASTLAKAAVSLAWRLDPVSQVDFQTTAGLNDNTPDVQIACGISRKF